MNTSRNANSSRHLNTSKLDVSKAKVLHQSTQNGNRRKVNNSLFWGTCNAGLVGMLAYDIINTSPTYYALILYAEYALFFTFLLNLLYHIVIYTKSSVKVIEPLIQLSPEKQSEPETFNTSFISYNMNKHAPCDTPTKFLSSTPINISWTSNMSSLNNSERLLQGSPLSELNNSANMSLAKPYHDSSQLDLIKDEQSLSEYLRGYENFEKSNHTNSPIAQPTNLLSTFWNHPAAAKTVEAPAILKQCNYQLSPASPTDSTNQFHSKSARYNNQLGIEMWKQLNVNHTTLTQWNANIRMWISQTILERLSNEFSQIDAALQKHGLTDIQIGCVGLERLRRTSQMAPVLQYIPTLSVLIPFLEVCSNQGYLVKRIRELATGGCMSNFKWNNGSSFNAKEWSDSLPTDSEILMHLFATYMDTQLLPLPNGPDTKPFSGCYYIKLNQEIPVSTQKAIQCMSMKPPHFRVLIGNEAFEMVQGYNNLFHTILFFLYQIYERDYGMLGGINLGKSGVNILWVINR